MLASKNINERIESFLKKIPKNKITKSFRNILNFFSTKNSLKSLNSQSKVNKSNKKSLRKAL